MPKLPDKLINCLNCGYEFNDVKNYCPSCGQKNRELKIPFRQLVAEVVENIFDIDTKAFQTLRFLLFKPGFLSTQFNIGKRIRFIPPIRLYLLVSFVFFFLMNIVSGPASNSSDLSSGQVQNSKSKTQLKYLDLNTSELAGLTKTQVDSIIIAKNIEPTKFNKWVIYQLHKIATDGMAQFTQVFIKNISYMMFILMPVLGLLIYVFYRKQVSYYMESLVVSIHFHSFVFLFYTIILLLNLIANQSIIYILWLIVPPIYILAALYKYFNRGFFVTVAKTFFIGLIYILCLFLLLMASVAISVFIV